MNFKNGGAAMLGLILSTLGMASIQPSASAETIYVKPIGEYATIDVKQNNAVGLALLHGTKEERSHLVTQVLAHSDKYNPAILCLVSRELLADGKKDEAAFWFYAGQLRSRTDGSSATTFQHAPAPKC